MRSDAHCAFPVSTQGKPSTMLAGIANFRDFGGYPTGDARRVRTGTLFRSGHLADATPEDLEKITALGLSVIVDLRWSAERRRHPTGRWNNGCRIITSDLGGDHDPWRAFLRNSDLSAKSIRDYIVGLYLRMPFEPSYIDLFSRFFAALATTSGALLVHCMGGKDRTGLVVALTHRLLGVPRDDILADYLLTNQLWAFDIHGASVACGIAEAAGRAPDQAAVRAVMEVEAAYLDAAFGAIEAGSGSFDAYFETVLGVTPAVRDAIVTRLTDNDQSQA
jgi:protein-tyrosine phosphatase